MNERELKDIKCENCGRVIGQRKEGMFYQFGLQILFTKSQKIFCPFIGCKFGQLFKVNREENKLKQKISLTKNFI